MNRKTPSPTGRDDFDRPPEPEWAALFAECSPPARPVDVVLLLSESIAKKPRRPHVPFFHRSNPMSRRIAVFASATAGIAAIVALVTLFGSSAPLTFAQVVETVAKTRSVTFKQTVTLPGKPADTMRATILADGTLRADMPDRTYTILDTQGNALCVSPREKKARLMRGLNPPSLNLYEMLRNIVAEKSRRLPDETLDGRNMNVFRIEVDEKIRKQSHFAMPPMKVWVDPETKLPVRMTLIVPEQEKSRATEEYSDIAFDQPVDLSRFSLTPPQGFAVTTQGQPASGQQAPPAAKELVAPEVIPGVGLGPVKFGMSKEEVIAILGEPDLEDRAGISYPSRGYNCVISPQRGLILVNCFSQRSNVFKVRDFAGKTKEGIGIGSSLEDLEKAFGKPTSARKSSVLGANSKDVSYNKLGLDFTLLDDKVVRFMLQPVR